MIIETKTIRRRKMTGKKFYNNINKPFKLIKWKIEANQCILLGSTVLTYVYQKDCGENICDHQIQEQKLKSSIRGIVLNLLVNEGDVVQPGAPLLEFDSCSHEIVLKGICANCGKDTWRSSVFNNFEGTGLKITQEEAEVLEKSGENRLLRCRKLALLICTDNILIDKQYKKNDTSCEVVTLPEYHLLPSTSEFLQSISNQYDIHFFTYGDKKESLNIARTLKKCGTFASQFVWSQDDFKHEESDKDKLRVIFPHGYSMVCVIDNNETKWKYNHNIIWVKSYQSFHTTYGDDKDQEQNINDNHIEKLGDTKLLLDLQHIVESNNQLINLLADQDCEKNSCNTKCINSFLMLVKDIYGKRFTNYATYLKQVLQSIHRGYYNLLDQMVHEHMYVIHHRVTPDINCVIPYVWKTILIGVNLIFCGIIPNNVNVETYPLWILAEALGANVLKDFKVDDKKIKITHIITTDLDKVSEAESLKNIFVVTVEWLYYCAFHWCRVNEQNFLLDKGSVPKNLDDLNPKNNDELCNKEVTSSEVNDDNEDLDLFNGHTINIDLSSKELDEMAEEVGNEIDESDSDTQESFLIQKKRYCSYKERLLKRRKCDSPWYEEEFSNISFSQWDHVSNNDSDNVSEVDDLMEDYIYSEDENPFLKDKYGDSESDFSDT